MKVAPSSFPSPAPLPSSFLPIAAVFLLLRLQLQQGNAAGALRTADTQLRRELGAKDPVHFRRTLMHAHARCVEALEAAKTTPSASTTSASASASASATAASAGAATSTSSARGGTGAGTSAGIVAAASAPVQLTAAQAGHVRAMRDLALELVEHKCAHCFALSASQMDVIAFILILISISIWSASDHIILSLSRCRLFYPFFCVFRSADDWSALCAFIEMQPVLAFHCAPASFLVTPSVANGAGSNDEQQQSHMTALDIAVAVEAAEAERAAQMPAAVLVQTRARLRALRAVEETAAGSAAKYVCDVDSSGRRVLAKK